MMDINMKYQLDKRDKKALLSDLKAEYIYIITPLVILVLVKLSATNWMGIFLSADWSLVSCVVFGQVTSKISKAVAYTALNKNHEAFGYYTAKRFFWVVISIVVYYTMLTNPSIIMGGAQVILFILASIFHFTDGVTTAMLQKNGCSSK